MGSVDLVMDFTDPIIRGTSLFHCHLLNHEDKEMMAMFFDNECIQTGPIGCRTMRFQNTAIYRLMTECAGCALQSRHHWSSLVQAESDYPVCYRQPFCLHILESSEFS
jgi:hypothetical protein